MTKEESKNQKMEATNDKDLKSNLCKKIIELNDYILTFKYTDATIELAQSISQCMKSETISFQEASKILKARLNNSIAELDKFLLESSSDESQKGYLNEIRSFLTQSLALCQV